MAVSAILESFGMADEPINVLDYAPAPSKRPLSDRFVPVILVLATTVFGAFLQSRFQPLLYTSVGYLTVSAPSPPPAVARLVAQQATHVTALQALVPTLPTTLRRSAGAAVTPAHLAANLKITPIPSSRLIAVAFTSDSPTQAAAVVNTLMGSYTAQASGIAIAVPGAVPSTSQRNLLYPLAGGFAGAIIGFILVALRHRQIQKRHATARPQAA
jgi:uncharacterized protein involved in exopolysaccharide biosynthesis